MDPQIAYEVDPNKLKPHPVAEAFPRLRGAAYKRFVASIEQHGQRAPAVVYEGKILDGLNRWRACKELKIALRVIDWDEAEGTERDFAIAANVDRRHLSAAQRAMIAVELLPTFEADAKQRQREAGRTRGNGHGANDDASAEQQLEPQSAQGRDDDPEPRGLQARDEVARLVGVGKTSVTEAKAIKKRAPEVAALVKRGSVRLPIAKQLAAVEPAARKHVIERVKNENVSYAEAIKQQRAQPKSTRSKAAGKKQVTDRDLTRALVKAKEQAAALSETLKTAAAIAKKLGHIPVTGQGVRTLVKRVDGVRALVARLAGEE